MAVNCEPGELAEVSACFNCFSEQSQLAIQTYLLCQISGMASCDPQDLIDEAKCFKCFSPAQLQAIIAYLLCEILDGGGGGGVGCSQHGNGSPEGVVTANIGCTYVQEDAPGVFWVKVANDGANTGWAVNT